MVSIANRSPAQLRFQALFSVSTQRQGLWLEPQACLPDLLRTVAQPADQAEETALSGDAGTAFGTNGDQRDVVYGFHVRSTRGRAQLSDLQCH